MMLAFATLAFAAAAQAQGDPAKGKQIASLWCGSCHQIGPDFPPRSPAPPFVRIARDPKYSREYISDWVIYPHTTMPHFRFSDEVLDHLVSHIRSLREFRMAVPRVGPPAPRLARFAIGSGFYVTQEGHLLATAHVVAQCMAITVEVSGYGRRAAERVSTAERLGLALLKTEMTPDGIAPMAPGQRIVPGGDVAVFGYPIAGTLLGDGVITTGHAVHWKEKDDTHFGIGLTLELGMSGSPVLDTRGRVVGMALSRLAALDMRHVLADGTSLGIRADALRPFLAKHEIAVARPAAGPPLTPEEISRQAQRYTAQVTCWR